VQHICSLAPLKRSIEWHMANENSKEMSTKWCVDLSYYLLSKNYMFYVGSTSCFVV